MAWILSEVWPAELHFRDGRNDDPTLSVNFHRETRTPSMGGGIQVSLVEIQTAQYIGLSKIRSSWQFFPTNTDNYLIIRRQCSLADACACGQDALGIEVRLI